MKKLVAAVAAAVLALDAMAPGQQGYEGQPGNQGNGQQGYEGQPGNQADRSITRRE